MNLVARQLPETEAVPGGYLHRRACPICAAPAARAEPFMASDPRAEDVPLDVHEHYFATENARRVFFSFWRCGECGGLYCPVYFTQAQLDHLYGSQNENMVEISVEARAATQRAYVDVVEKFAPLRGNYLELGADIGLFTEAAAARGKFDKFYLFEPNRAVHTALARRMQGRDVHISGELYRPGLLREKIDLAVIIHALDHLIDPAATLRAIYDDLAPGGSVFIVTHNEGSLLAKLDKWPPYTIQHPQLFRPSSMKRLVERCGFKLSGFAGTANYFPVHFLARKALGLAGFESFVKGWNRSPYIRLQLGNLGTVCQKPL